MYVVVLASDAHAIHEHKKLSQIHYLPSDLILIGGEVSLIVDDSAGESNGPPKT